MRRRRLLTASRLTFAATPAAAAGPTSVIRLTDSLQP